MTPPPEPTPTRTPLPAFEPLADDVQRDAKRVAGRFVQHLVTYEPGEDLGVVVARSIEAGLPGLDPGQVAAAAVPLHHADARSEGAVVYPQLGGLAPHGEPRTASVMVVVEQRLEHGRQRRAVRRTVDVRVERRDGAWRIADLADAGGEEVASDGLEGVAADVLDDSRIDLPDSARWDIAAGAVHDGLLRTMLEMAGTAAYAVAVLRSGHPVHVFGTDRVSDHTVGRAVDVWAVDGQPVVRQREEGTPAWEMARRLFDGGVSQLGAPWAFDPPGGRSFTDPVHADHLHVAYRGD